jgi:hypothetical protein
LFDLPLILGKLQALVLGETTSNAWLNTWLVVTSSFTLENIRVWCYCVFWIMLGWSSKFTIWRWSKWKPWSTSQWPRGRRNTCYIACFIYVILSQHYFQVCYTSLGNVALILSSTSFQSFEAIGCLWHS